MRKILCLLALALAGCEALNPSEGDSSSEWVHVDAGYPFTAYLDPDDSVTTGAGERIPAPRPPWLDAAVTTALTRWSRALAPTDVRRWEAATPDWHPDITPGAELKGFHVVISWGWCFGGAGSTMGNRTDVDGRPLIGRVCLNATVPFSREGAANVVAHEIGHLLGFDTPFDTERILANVNRIAKERTGLDVVVATRVPVSGAHWDRCFTGRLMSPGEGDVLGALTILAMQHEWAYDESAVDEPAIPNHCWR